MDEGIGYYEVLKLSGDASCHNTGEVLVLKAKGRWMLLLILNIRNHQEPVTGNHSHCWWRVCASQSLQINHQLHLDQLHSNTSGSLRQHDKSVV